MTFREMRRNNQQLSTEECIAVLRRGTSGVLAVVGDGGYPYAIPLSYVYHDGALFFHGASVGHKLDAIRQNEKFSFCVIDHDEVIPEKLTTAFRSVIVFGKARILSDPTEIRAAAQILGQKYSPGLDAMVNREIEVYLNQMAVVRLEIEHMTGKIGKELMK